MISHLSACPAVYRVCRILTSRESDFKTVNLIIVVRGARKTRWDISRRRSPAAMRDEVVEGKSERRRRGGGGDGKEIRTRYTRVGDSSKIGRSPTPISLFLSLSGVFMSDATFGLSCGPGVVARHGLNLRYRYLLPPSARSVAGA